MHEPTPERARDEARRSHRRPAALLPLRRRGLKREVKELLPRVRAPHHRGLRPHRDLADADAEPPRRVPLRHGRQAAPVGRAQARRGRRDPRARPERLRAATTRIPAATREAFTDDGWFKTGDVGRFTDDGFLQIIDRKKDILVTAGGKNVPPANIELRFRDDPFIAHVVVYGDGEALPRRRRVAERRAVDAHLGDVAPRARCRATRARAEARRPGERRARELRDDQEVRDHRRAPLTVEDGLLTPSLKVRRKKVYERFRDRFEALYAMSARDAAKSPRSTRSPRSRRRAPKARAVGTTPHDVVCTREQVAPAALPRAAQGRAYATPVLLVPSLINRHYVLDLLPGKSFAE